MGAQLLAFCWRPAGGGGVTKGRAGSAIARGFRALAQWAGSPSTLRQCLWAPWVRVWTTAPLSFGQRPTFWHGWRGGVGFGTRSFWRQRVTFRHGWRAGALAWRFDARWGFGVSARGRAWDVGWGLGVVRLGSALGCEALFRGESPLPRRKSSSEAKVLYRGNSPLSEALVWVLWCGLGCGRGCGLGSGMWCGA